MPYSHVSIVVMSCHVVRRDERMIDFHSWIDLPYFRSINGKYLAAPLPPILHSSFRFVQRRRRNSPSFILGAARMSTAGREFQCRAHGRARGAALGQNGGWPDPTYGSPSTARTD